MKYELDFASKNNIDLLKNYKLKSILDYAKDITPEEKNKIINYVDNNISKDIKLYKTIKVAGKISGCVLLTRKNNDLLLDELFIDEEYRGKGIGTSIINNIIKDNQDVHLWVYKENKNAIKLYKKLGFKIKEETETRYYMYHE